MKRKGAIAWIKDESTPRLRSWEEFYRNRHQHDKVVRSTHGVNCTGSCSWNIHVKNGVVVRILRSLAPPSVWEYDKTFVGSLKAAEAFLWSVDNGLIAQFTAGIL